MNRLRLGKISLLAVTAILFLFSAATRSIVLQVLGVVLLGLVLWSLYPSHLLPSSILIVVLLSILESSFDFQVFISSLFTSYGRSGLWIIVSGFILAEAMRSSGLARRVAIWIVSILSGDANLVLLSVALASLAISPLSPSTTAKTFLILPVCTGIIEAFGAEKGRSKFAASIMLMAMVANNICSTAFLTGTVPNPIAAAQIEQATGIDLNWGSWFAMAFPLSVLLLLASWLVCRCMFKPDVEGGREVMERIKKLRAQAGPLNRGEVIVAIIFTSSILLWSTEPLHHINGGLVSLGLSLIVFLPRVGVMKVNGFAAEIPWGPIGIFFASMFLAFAVGHWKVFNPIAIFFFNTLNLEALSHEVFINLTVLVTMLFHLLFTSTTVFATVMVPLTISLANVHEIPPQLIAIPVAFLAPVAVILPVNTIPNVIFFTTGYFTQKQMIIYGIVISLLSVLIVIAIGFPYWKFLGLL